MKRFAQVFIERLQWTRLRLLDVYGDASPELAPAAGPDGAAAVRGLRPGAGDRGHLDADARAGRRASRRAVAPGQFVMVYVFGVGEVPISVSGAAIVRHRSCSLSARSARSARAICASEPGASARRPRAVRHRLADRRVRRAQTWSSSPAESGSLRSGPSCYQRSSDRARVRQRRSPLRRPHARRTCSTERSSSAGARSASRRHVTVDAAEPDWRGKVGWCRSSSPARPLRPAARRSPSSAAPRS